MTFFQLESAQGKDLSATYGDFEYLVVDWSEDFGLQTLSAYDIAKLNDNLS